jgi:hypothetical protein
VTVHVCILEADMRLAKRGTKDNIQFHHEEKEVLVKWKKEKKDEELWRGMVGEFRDEVMAERRNTPSAKYLSLPREYPRLFNHTNHSSSEDGL